MKQIVLFLLLTAGQCAAQIDSLNEVLETRDDFLSASELFHQGKASTGEEFFAGLLAEIIVIDVQYREMEEADNVDASTEEIVATIDACLLSIDHLRASLNHYRVERWPHQREFSELSLSWIANVEDLLTEFARPLASAMAKPDEEWTDEEYAIYERWRTAYDAFLVVDEQWVAFQHVYAEANDFTLSETTIDVDGLMGNEDLATDDQYSQSLENQWLNFHLGSPASVNDYFDALVTQIVMVEVHYKTMEKQADDGAREEDVLANIDEALDLIDFLRTGLKANLPPKWKIQSEFTEISFKWIDLMEEMFTKYARPMSAVLSKPIEECTKKEKKILEQWQETYAKYLTVDAEWVAFQNAFAHANDIQLNGMTIDPADFIESDE